MGRIAGIRKNVARVSENERARLKDAFLTLNKVNYPGKKEDFPQLPPGGVSYWFKQDEIHDGTHVHFCPQFLPWHRELCNRFEELLREVDPLRWVANFHIPPGSTISVVARNPNQLDLFVVGYDGGIYSTWWNPHDGWETNHNWFRIGAAINFTVP